MYLIELVSTKLLAKRHNAFSRSTCHQMSSFHEVNISRHGLRNKVLVSNSCCVQAFVQRIGIHSRTTRPSVWQVKGTNNQRFSPNDEDISERDDNNENELLETSDVNNSNSMQQEKKSNNKENLLNRELSIPASPPIDESTNQSSELQQPSLDSTTQAPKQNQVFFSKAAAKQYRQRVPIYNKKSVKNSTDTTSSPKETAKYEEKQIFDNKYVRKTNNNSGLDQEKARFRAIRSKTVTRLVEPKQNSKNNTQKPLTELERERARYRKMMASYGESLNTRTFDDAISSIQENRPLLLPGTEEIIKFLDDPILDLILAGCALLLLLCYGLETNAVKCFYIDQMCFNYQPVLDAVEYSISAVFGVQLLLQWWVTGLRPSYLVSPSALVDILTIVPVLYASQFSVFSLLRVFRILRLVRLLRPAEFDRLVSTVFMQGKQTKVPEYYLQVAQVVFTIICIICINAGVVYEVEHRGNPAFQNFFDALYFSVTTLTTVGFGDLVPITEAGRFTVSLSILVGVILIPTQLSALASSLLKVVGEQTTKEIKCESCGLLRHDEDAHFCKICGGALLIIEDDDDYWTDGSTDD